MELSVHTMIIGHQISELEAKRICQMHNVNLLQEVKINPSYAGINELIITRNMKRDRYSKKELGYRYMMYLEVYRNQSI